MKDGLTRSSQCSHHHEPSRRGTEHLVPEDLAVFLEIAINQICPRQVWFTTLHCSNPWNNLHHFQIRMYIGSANPNHQIFRFSAPFPASLPSSSKSMSRCSHSAAAVVPNVGRRGGPMVTLHRRTKQTDCSRALNKFCAKCLHKDRNVPWLSRGGAWIFWHEKGASVFDRELGKFWTRAVRDRGWP